MVLKKIGLLVTILVSACSSLPDKEKEYQLTSEIPPLILPDDILNKEAKTFSNQDIGFGRSVELIENNEDVDREESILLDLGNILMGQRWSGLVMLYKDHGV